MTRRAMRQSASAAVLVSSSHGNSISARLNDISTYGCNVVADADWMRCGMFVSIQLTAEKSVQAIVRWIRSGSCGVEFLRPIPDGDADTLAAQWNI
ncbi:PilZ domain-containing protein [Novosphingobium sp.]|uniref:PilZ domain-containing protein n=1 Tax=Novosphingobium sp. TaxID=1874826 RepID=UPI00345C0231